MSSVSYRVTVNSRTQSRDGKTQQNFNSDTLAAALLTAQREYGKQAVSSVSISVILETWVKNQPPASGGPP